MIKKKFKDKCDKCNQMKVCKGFKEWVLCENCIKEYNDKKINVGDKDGQAKFDF